MRCPTFRRWMPSSNWWRSLDSIAWEKCGAMATKWEVRAKAFIARVMTGIAREKCRWRVPSPGRCKPLLALFADDISEKCGRMMPSLGRCMPTPTLLASNISHRPADECLHPRSKFPLQSYKHIIYQTFPNFWIHTSKYLSTL